MRYCPKCANELTDREQMGVIRETCSNVDCGYIFYDNPIPVVGGVVEYEGNIVLVQNKGWPESWYGLVTGFLEKCESPEMGMLRELREELNLEGTIQRLIGVYSFVQMNQVIIAYEVKASGELRLGDELAAYKLVAPEKLRPWPLGTGLAVADYIAYRMNHAKPE